MTNETKQTGTSIGTVLLLIFVVLKLTGAIHWSWWWVLCPAWLPFTVIIIFLIIHGILKLLFPHK